MDLYGSAVTHCRAAPGAQSTDLYNKETLPTMLKGSSLYIGMMNGMPLIQVHG